MKPAQTTLRKRTISPTTLAIGLAVIALIVPIVLHLAGGGADPVTEPPQRPQAAADAPAAPQTWGETSTRPQSQLVTKREIEQTRAGSPERALLEFWREVQYENVPDARQYFARDARPSLRRFAVDLRTLSGSVQFKDIALKVQEVDVKGNAATVRTTQIAETHPEVKVFQYNESASSFKMVKAGGEWQLADDWYFDNALASYGGG